MLKWVIVRHISTFIKSQILFIFYVSVKKTVRCYTFCHLKPDRLRHRSRYNSSFYSAVRFQVYTTAGVSKRFFCSSEVKIYSATSSLYPLQQVFPACSSQSTAVCLMMDQHVCFSLRVIMFCEHWTRRSCWLNVQAPYRKVSHAALCSATV